MSFDERDIRPGLDVYASDGVYLGTVIKIVRHAVPAPGAEDARSPAPGDVGRVEGTSARAFTGERLGPMPTAPLGNRGPVRQARAAAFATAPSGEPSLRPTTELLVFRWLTALDWSTLRPRLRRVPISLVRLVALERIVLSATAAELDGAR